MQTFTTQAHQRNYQGNVVLNRPPKTPHRQGIFKVVTTVMALIIIFTGSILGATTVHNHRLQAEISALQAQQKPPISEQQHETTALPQLPSD